MPSNQQQQTQRPVGYQTTHDATILVTGSSGLVGARLVEILLTRHARRVLCFDITPPSPQLLARFTTAASADASRFVIFSGLVDGNLTEAASVEKAFRSEERIDVVYHMAALVGPFHDREMYMAVNYHGSMHILNQCQQRSVPRMVYSSSPSTRFTGDDVEGVREEELPIPKTFLALYAETKAYAEVQILAACAKTKDDIENNNKTMTIAVAPHQVYGPHDRLFLPSLLETAASGKLRIFGPGNNKVSFCYVDNYCHGLICGADSMRTAASPSLGKFYIITDGGEENFWKFLDEAIVGMGFPPLKDKFHLPTGLLMAIAYFCNFLGWVLKRKFKLNPFTVKMLVIHRYFSIENAKRDLGYRPLVETEEAWPLTIDWFRKNWLPGHLERMKSGTSGVVDMKKRN